MALSFFLGILLLLSTTHALSAMKRILVTGGNKGIGKAICERLLTEWPNDTYVLLGARDAARGQAAVEELVAKLGCGDRLSMLELDTNSDESVEKAAAQVKGDGEPLYGIINNAGVRA